MNDEQMRNAIKSFLKFATITGPEFVLRYGEFERDGKFVNYEKWVERSVTEQELDEAITDWLTNTAWENE